MNHEIMNDDCLFDYDVVHVACVAMYIYSCCLSSSMMLVAVAHYRVITLYVIMVIPFLVM